MSGIVGLFRRDGGTACCESVQAMVASIRHRGPDQCGIVCADSVGLGHAMLRTTPESLYETLPRVDSEAGLTISADARIDNRDELIAELGILRSDPSITDSELILKAYRKWGFQCPERLIGDFAFAIWDQRLQQMFCARDPMGVKCLYYFASPAVFAFGSEIKALVCLNEVPLQLNEQRVLDYLANLFTDRAITFYSNIFRLPAASTAVVSRHDLKIAKYWALDSNRELKLSSDAEYTEVFLDCFTKAVRARTRSAFPIGSALSGGLDSSSIACVAKQGAPGHVPLHTFSLIFPSLPDRSLSRIDERKYIDNVLRQGGFQPHFIRGDETSPLSEVDCVHRHLDEAFFEGNLYLHWAMYRAASQEKVRVFLDGFDGDSTVSHGFEYLADLVVKLRWHKLWREVRMLCSNLGMTPKAVIRDYCVKPLCPTWVYNGWRRMHGRPLRVKMRDTFIAAGFKERLKLEERVKTLILTRRSCTRTAREKHWEKLDFPLYAHALEVADKASAAFGVEARYPFFDRRLLELCLALPASQKFGQGWNRFILRRAMHKILPETVQWRPTKADLSPNFFLQLLKQDGRVLDRVANETPSDLEPFVDLPSFRKAQERFTANPLGPQDEGMRLFATANLAIWLRTAGLRP
jgi:asparagine synthase (glutamine-hydrolysing)